MKRQATLVLPYQAGAIKLNEEQEKALFGGAPRVAEIKGHLRTIGPWQLPVSYTALCTSCAFNREVYPVEHGPLHVYGLRTLTKVRESGYQLEGRVSVNGKTYRGFTSTQLFERPDGTLTSVATIHACGAAS